MIFYNQKFYKSEQFLTIKSQINGEKFNKIIEKTFNVIKN